MAGVYKGFKHYDWLCLLLKLMLVALTIQLLLFFVYSLDGLQNLLKSTLQN